MSSGIPVLFLPGLLCDAALWQQQIQALGKEIAPQVADLTQYDNMRDLARDVLAKAPPQFAMAALSMGGYVAFEIMRQSPERILKLCLFDTSARADTTDQKERRRLLLAMSRSGQFKGVTPRLLPLLIHPGRLEDKELTGIVMTMAERVGREAFQRQQTAILDRADSRADLKDIKCPTIVIGGREDAITPPEIVCEMANGIPQATYHVVENCGHLTPLEQPEIATKLLRRWLV